MLAHRQGGRIPTGPARHSPISRARQLTDRRNRMSRPEDSCDSIDLVAAAVDALAQTYNFILISRLQCGGGQLTRSDSSTRLTLWSGADCLRTCRHTL